MNEQTVKIDIRKLEKDDLKKLFLDWGEPAFRAKQVYEWIWNKSVTDFKDMNNLSKDLRAKLDENLEIRPIQLDKMQKSIDGTLKSRFRLHDGHLIESVLIPVPVDDRYTVCVSSQVGCSLSCKFCATGKMKRERNLDASEIYDQVVEVNKQSLEHFGKPLSNIVFMGMGEPLLAYREVLRSIDIISSPDGLGMSARRITVSTAGIAKMIKKLADDNPKVKLALSLHAADDHKRNQIMPINEQNNLEVLMDAMKYFFEKSGKRISYEYIAFKNFNDSIEDANRLLKLCRSFPVIINIIEYNPIDGVEFIKSEEDSINQFAQHLRDRGVMVTVRRSRGKDIDAACGQLANKG